MHPPLLWLPFTWETRCPNPSRGGEQADIITHSGGSHWAPSGLELPWGNQEVVALPRACLSSSQPPSAMPGSQPPLPPTASRRRRHCGQAEGRERGRRSGAKMAVPGPPGRCGRCCCRCPPAPCRSRPGDWPPPTGKKISKTQPPPAPRLGGREQKGLGKVVFDRQGWVAVLVAVGEVV